MTSTFLEVYPSWVVEVGVETDDVKWVIASGETEDGRRLVK